MPPETRVATLGMRLPLARADAMSPCSFVSRRGIGPQDPEQTLHDAHGARQGTQLVRSENRMVFRGLYPGRDDRAADDRIPDGGHQ